jgi:hypothetical protein
LESNSNNRLIDTGIIERLRRQLANTLSNFDNVLQVQLQVLRDDYSLNEDAIDYPVRFATDVISDQDVLTSDNDRSGGSIQFGAVKANLESTSDLLRLELGVRGDPYWMGRPNSLLNQQRSSEELVDYEAGSPNFFLQVNLPNATEDGAGRRKPQPDYQISGIYKVYSVINRFQNGMFTQYLDTVRDLATNVSTVWDQLAGDTDTIDALTQAQQRDAIRNIAQENEDAYRRAAGTP